MVTIILTMLDKIYIRILQKLNPCLFKRSIINKNKITYKMAEPIAM